MTNKIILSNNSKELLKDTFLTRLSPQDLNTKLDEAYLGILTDDSTLFNPFNRIPVAASDKFAEYVLYLMSQPEYFYFIMKYILQIDSFPLQCLMLSELYKYRFPILVGSRGLSKCEVGKNLLVTKNGIRTIKSLVPDNIEYIQQKCDNKLYGENGFSEVEYSWYNGKKKTKKIKTRSGRTMECTFNHPLRVVSNGEICWKNAENITIGDYLPIQRKYEEWNHNNLDEDVAYMIGAMVGDGCYSNTSSGLGFTNIDQDCINNVNIGLKKWKNADLKISATNNIQYTVKGELSNKFYKKSFIEEFGCDNYSGTGNKITPKIIMSAPFSAIASYLQGLFDTDGCCHTNNCIVEFSSKSYQLAEETQFLLLILGINSFLKTQFNKKYNKNYYKLQISGSSLRIFRDTVGFRINRKQETLNKHCLKTSNDNTDIIPLELIGDKLLKLREFSKDTVYKTKHNKYGANKISPYKLKKYNPSYNQLRTFLNLFGKSPLSSKSKEYTDLNTVLNNNYYYDQIVSIEEGYEDTYDVHLKGDDHSFISNGFISHNSFSLAVYMLIKMILNPGVGCIITSAGFRQSKVVFEYMERIWKKSLILQNCFKGGKNGPTHGTDVWTFRLGDSVTYALPVGPDGSKVRGYRANCVHKNTLIQTDRGLIKIKDFQNKACTEVINMNGALEVPKSHYSTELTDVYELTTENGYSIKYSKVHQLHTSDGWKVGTDFQIGDEIYLDNNDFFPNEYAKHNGLKLDESELFYSGIINLSTFELPEIPWYILQSPRNIVTKFLNMIFGQYWLGKKTSSEHKEKIQQLQILLLKFDFISKITEDNGIYTLEVTKQHLAKGKPADKVISIKKLDEQDNLYDFVLPETNSFCGGGFINHNCLISEEFASMNRQIFEEVMSGFLSVASSPVEQIKLNARHQTMKKYKIPIPKSDGNKDFMQNQLILCGTAHYKINHFYHYFTKWHSIIESKKNPKILEGMFDDPNDAKNINPDDYCITRVPIELVTGGYMDMDQVNRIKVSTTKDVYLREYSAVFSNDSDGFFKNSLIESCTVTEDDPQRFSPALYGDISKKYVYGVDPAYQGDNFAIVILEINDDHRRIVHVWTTQSSDHKQRLKAGLIAEHDYYHFCMRKIRDLMKRFPCEYIAIDSQGGGKAVMEALTDITKIRPGEHVILPTIEPGEKGKETDHMPGLHILKIINPNNAWNAEANFLLKKDMEDKTIRFPISDAISYALAEYYDESIGEGKELYDTLDDCVYEIDELKKELTSIVVTETAGSKEKFDTPSIKAGINKKGKLKKDRYSALLMANYVARNILPAEKRLDNPDLINLFGFTPAQKSTQLFRGNSKVADQLNKLFESKVIRK